MEQKFDIGLNAKINEFIKRFDIDKSKNTDNDRFEDFSNYTIISNKIGEDLEEIGKISTGKSQGIDGIAIIVNNKIIYEESDLDKLGENEKLDVILCFIQSTTQKSFDLKKFQSFVDESINFLLLDLKIEPFTSVYSKLFDENNRFLNNFSDTPKLNLYFSSARTKHSIDNESIAKEKRKITHRNELENKFTLEDIYFLQKEELKQQFENISKFHIAQLKFNKSIQLDSRENVEISLLTTIKFEELKKVILNKDEKLREKLFVDNVRTFIGETDVNLDIKKTLSDNKQRNYFLFLNNGLTIMCDKIERHPVKQQEFILKYPRIINGCQTSHILFEKYKETPKEIDEIEIVAKIIATEDKFLKKEIIFAANNQNAIDKDLQSLNEFHEKIEQYFQGNDSIDLYYERLRGQYSKVSPPYRKINIENLAKIYISVLLLEPHKMKSNAIKKINEYQSKNRLYNSEKPEDIKDYFYCAVLNYWFNYFITNKIISLKTKTMDMHLLMAVNKFLDKNGITTTEAKIEYLTNDEQAQFLFEKANNYLSKEDYLFERRGFYSAPKTRKLIESIKNS